MARLELLSLLVVPALLLGPILLSGRVFLPQVPVAHEPLRSEHPEAAREALAATNYVHGDRLFPALTEQIAAREAIQKGELPLWEPMQGLGLPLFAGSIAGLAYPPNWLALLVPPERAAGPLAALALLLAGLGMWLFLGRLGFSPGTRLFAALAYQLGGWAIANLYFFMKVDAALWLPWALWAIEGVARRKRGNGLALTLTIAASLLSGMIGVGLFVVGASALYLLLRGTRLGAWSRFEPGAAPDTAGSGDPPRSTLPWAGLFLGLGALAGAVLLLPAAELSRESDRVPKDADTVAAESLPIGTICGTVLVDFVGSPTESTPRGALPVAWWLTPAEDFSKAERSNQLEWSTYAGAAVFLLALVGLVATPRRALLPALLLLAVVGFAQGWPVVRWAYAVPGLNVGAPGRVLSLAWFLWPWLAAVGVEAWLRREPRSAPALFTAAFAAAALFFFLWISIEPESWAVSVEDGLIERYADSHAPDREEIRARLPFAGTVAAGSRLQSSLAIAFGSSLALCAAALVGLLHGRPREAFARGLPAHWWAVLLLGILVLALAPASRKALETDWGWAPAILAVLGGGLLSAFAWRRSPVEERARWLPLALVVLAEGLVAASGHLTGHELGERGLFPPSEGVDAVRAAAGDARVIRFDTTESGVGDVVELARPNLLQPYHVADLSPWIVFYPKRMNQLFAAVDPGSRWRQGVARISNATVLGHPVLDLARVGAILSREPLEHPRLEAVLNRPGFHVYRRTGALDPARVVTEAVVATNEEAGLIALASGAIAFDRQTLIAAEHAQELDAPHTPSGDAGRIASIERPTRGSVEVRVENSSGGWLVLHEQTFPGWQARVNGEEVAILRADHVYQAVRIPAGTSVVTFRYRPTSFFTGLMLTLGAVLAAGFLSVRFSV